MIFFINLSYYGKYGSYCFILFIMNLYYKFELVLKIQELFFYFIYFDFFFINLSYYEKYGRYSFILNNHFIQLNIYIWLSDMSCVIL